MTGVALVTVLALIEVMVFGFQVGQARQRYKIEAPATSGHPIFERYNRVHQNTIEQLIVFVPLVWIFATNVHAPTAVALGLLFVIGRAIYAAGYVRDPARRGTGAIITFAVLAVLALGSLAGAIWQLL